VRLARFEHGALEPHRDPREETSPDFSINFVERGSFEIEIRRRAERFEPGMVLLASPGLAYRCRHGEEFLQDVCVSVQFTDPAGGAGWHLPRGPAVQPTNRLTYSRLRLLAGETARRLPMALEGLAMELLGAVGEAGAGLGGRIERDTLLVLDIYRREGSRWQQVASQVARHPDALAEAAAGPGVSRRPSARRFCRSGRPSGGPSSRETSPRCDGSFRRT
jgi:hypothetical protein